MLQRRRQDYSPDERHALTRMKYSTGDCSVSMVGVMLWVEEI